MVNPLILLAVCFEVGHGVERLAVDADCFQCLPAEIFGEENQIIVVILSPSLTFRNDIASADIILEMLNHLCSKTANAICVRTECGITADTVDERDAAQEVMEVHTNSGRIAVELEVERNQMLVFITDGDGCASAHGDALC